MCAARLAAPWGRQGMGALGFACTRMVGRAVDVEPVAGRATFFPRTRRAARRPNVERRTENSSRPRSNRAECCYNEDGTGRPRLFGTAHGYGFACQRADTTASISSFSQSDL